MYHESTLLCSICAQINFSVTQHIGVPSLPNSAFQTYGFDSSDSFTATLAQHRVLEHWSAQRATGGGKVREGFERQGLSCSESTMGLLQLGCLAWIHLAIAVTVNGQGRTELFDYGVQHGDQLLGPGSDQTEELALDQTIYFYKGSFESVYVSRPLHSLTLLLWHSCLY